MWNEKILPLPTRYKVSKELKAVPIVAEWMKKNPEFVKMAESGYLVKVKNKNKNASKINDINSKFLNWCKCKQEEDEENEEEDYDEVYIWHPYCDETNFKNLNGKCEKDDTFSMLTDDQIIYEHSLVMQEVAELFQLPKKDKWGEDMEGHRYGSNGAGYINLNRGNSYLRSYRSI